MKHIRPISPMSLIGLICLLFSIGFNLWIYRLEPTAKSDPNDNTFQFALVDRTNQIFDFANKTCPKNISFIICHLSFLGDHWVPNWAEGYNLPYYYSHIPQILIVTTYRLFSEFSIFIFQFLLKISNYKFQISLFTYYHWIIYLLLSFFPVSLFLAVRIIGLSWLTAGFGALIATQLSTDGLYGLDPSSFLWRGYGLSSQLFSMIWLPLALAFAYRGRVLPAILTLAATTAGHLGIGIIAFLSIAVISLGHLKKLFLIYGGVFLLLGYWILPILLHGNFHNISVWDGIWKFDSFGYREVLKNLFNGDLFDFGRLPVLTALVFLGGFSALQSINYPKSYLSNHKSFFPFSLLFVFWVLMYFGRTTWGGLMDLIPGMSEFHLSRFIVGVHIAGLFLIPMGFESIINGISNRIRIHSLFAYLFICIFVYSLIAPQTWRYASHNDYLINRANENFARDATDIDSLFLHLKSNLSARPGRVFAGRGGSWGKDFRIAETPIYMYLSTYGIPVILWLPETWSPNSDTEQYFSENNPDHYGLYNVRYVVTPTDLSKEHIQPFWKPLKAGKAWRLYSVVIPAQAGIGSGSISTTQIPDQVGNDKAFGYITPGIRPAIVSSTKTDYRSVVRLWMHSDYPKLGLYPELTFDKNYPKNKGLPNFRMLDEVTYKVPAGTTHNLFSEIPVYTPLSSPSSPIPPISLISQSSDSDMVFSASIDVPKNCAECIVVLRQTFHPSWKATVDGKPASTFTVFPFYTAVPVSDGNHEVIFSYRPSGLKIALLVLSLIALISLSFVTLSR